MESILARLEALSQSDFYPYHMPGHKRNGSPDFALDITEIDDFDNLSHATGILKEAQNRAAKLYGAKESFFLVNGSTCGILTAVHCAFQRGDRILVARNCHKAVYHAIELRGLKPVYLYPDVDEVFHVNMGIMAKAVKKILESPQGQNLKGMILTSPTYEGEVSEIKEIACMLHERNMMLVVDEAHGAHFGFHPAFPESAVNLGADLVIQSLHKTLPSMTQTALLHLCSDKVSVKKAKKYLGMFQTSSPSYVFMAHMDECIRMLENEGKQRFEALFKRLKIFYEKCNKLTYIQIKQYENSDPGKIFLSAPGYLTGKELYDKLRETYHLQPEMCSLEGVLMILTICDTKEGFLRLEESLQEIDIYIGQQEKEKAVSENSKFADERGLLRNDYLKTGVLYEEPFRRYYPWETEGLEGRRVFLREASGMVSLEYLYLYPPGIPFIVPGEVISEEILKKFLLLQENGYELQGLSDATGESILVSQ